MYLINSFTLKCMEDVSTISQSSIPKEHWESLKTTIQEIDSFVDAQGRQYYLDLTDSDITSIYLYIKEYIGKPEYEFTLKFELIMWDRRSKYKKLKTQLQDFLHETKNHIGKKSNPLKREILFNALYKVFSSCNRVDITPFVCNFLNGVYKFEYNMRDLLIQHLESLQTDNKYKDDKNAQEEIDNILKILKQDCKKILLDKLQLDVSKLTYDEQRFICNCMSSYDLETEFNKRSNRKLMKQIFKSCNMSIIFNDAALIYNGCYNGELKYFTKKNVQEYLQDDLKGFGFTPKDRSSSDIYDVFNYDLQFFTFNELLQIMQMANEYSNKYKDRSDNRQKQEKEQILQDILNAVLYKSKKSKKAFKTLSNKAYDIMREPIITATIISWTYKPIYNNNGEIVYNVDAWTKD